MKVHFECAYELEAAYLAAAPNWEAQCLLLRENQHLWHPEGEQMAFVFHVAHLWPHSEPPCSKCPHK